MKIICAAWPSASPWPPGTAAFPPPAPADWEAGKTVCGPPQKALPHSWQRMMPVRRRADGPRQPGISRHGPLHREGLAVQLELVEEVAAVGCVHQQQADACVLLLRKLIRPQAPQIPQRKIAGTVQICILATVAALAQKQRPAKGRPKPVANKGAESAVPSSYTAVKWLFFHPSTLLRKRTFASRRRLFPSINRASSSHTPGDGTPWHTRSQVVRFSGRHPKKRYSPST